MASSNLWKRLVEVLNPRPLLIGTVTETDGVSSTVTLPGGATLSVIGTAAVDAKVFVKDGIIQGLAPTLDIVEITI